MPIFIQKLSESGGQYRVTLPKDLLKQAGLEKVRVVEIWVTEDHIIHMREYNAKRAYERGSKAGRAEVN